MLRGIRGAITVPKNSKAQIIEATARLLREMVRVNRVKTGDIASIIFSVTWDLDAEFPAQAAHKLNWKDTPLLCTYEIAVPGSLKKCIRVLMHVNTGKKQKEIKPVYLREARRLRKESNS
jgi:chorismate mutase